MLKALLGNAWVHVLVFLSTFVEAGLFNGPAFPSPTTFAGSQSFQDALESFNKALDAALKDGLPGDQLGSGYPLNTTSFSVAMFSTSSSGLVYERHYTDPVIRNGTVGTHKVDADSVYRVGSVSKLFTVYLLLILDGERRLNDAVTEYLPELATAASNSAPKVPASPDWNEITIGDLTCHLAGIARDYGLNDADYRWDVQLADSLGFPELASSLVAPCDHFTAALKYLPCRNEEFLNGIANQPALFPPGFTPAYSNNAFDILGIVLERIRGASFEELIQRHILDPLVMKHTSVSVPMITNHSVIPTSAADSGWSNDLGVLGATAGFFSSANDLAALGRAILNSTLLSKATTRRWMKPRSFTDDPMAAVGAPWEIARIGIGSRIVDLYTKDGNWGGYAAYIGLLPDFNIGFSVLAASLPRPQPAMTTYAIRRLIESILVPALEKIAKEEAAASFGGTYRSASSNSSMNIDTDDEPGLKITSWTSEGANILATMRSVLKEDGEPTDVNFRLYPNLLYPERSGTVGFAASTGFLTGTGPVYPAWESIDGFTYGSIGIDNFVFEVDRQTGLAINAQPLAWRETLAREV